MHQNFYELGCESTFFVELRLMTLNIPRQRVNAMWHSQRRDDPDTAILNTLPGNWAIQLDRFDAVQLAKVVSVCRDSKSLAEAGRRLFEHSRQKKKYLFTGYVFYHEGRVGRESRCDRPTQGLRRKSLLFSYFHLESGTCFLLYSPIIHCFEVKAGRLDSCFRLRNWIRKAFLFQEL